MVKTGGELVKDGVGYEQTDSERYILQMLRINQVSILLILIFVIDLSTISWGLRLGVTIGVIMLIGANILAYIHSAFGVDVSATLLRWVYD